MNKHFICPVSNLACIEEGMHKHLQNLGVHYNLAGFADWQMKLSEHTKWGIGLRYEHVIYDFFEDQIKSDLESKVYNNIFPTLSFSSAIGQVNYGFDYHVRTIRPAYEMFKSAVNYGNRLTYMSGTPSLQPTYIHELGINAADKRQNMSTKSSGAVNMSIYKEWMNGKLSCLLEATDLFHTQKEAFTLYLSKTKEYSSSSSNTRGISLTLRYSLNGKNNRYKGTGAGEEELRRL